MTTQTAAIVAALIVAAGLIVSSMAAPYQIVPAGGSMVIRLDRVTGRVVLCLPVNAANVQSPDLICY